MKKFVEFNGVVFEVKNPIDILMVRQRKALYECYKNPSRVRESVYLYWRDYVFNTFKYVENFGIESYNEQMFTLGWTTTSGAFYITKTRHEFYPYKCD